MGKYEEYVSKFLEDYEQPTIDDYIVGFSGLDPDKKVKPETLPHERLDGLLGGNAAGHYHVTREQLSEFIGYRGQIDSLESETAEEFGKVRNELSDGLSGVESRAGEKINRLRSDVEGQISTLEATTSAEISRVEREAQAEISRVERDSQAEIQRVDDKSVQSLANYKGITDGRITELDEEIREVSSQTGTRLSELERGQGAIEFSQTEMTARYDEAISGVTEDTEILDARVSQDGTRYATLGGYLRSLESGAASGLEELHESDARLWGAIQEESANTGETLLRVLLDACKERQERRDNVSQIYGELCQRQSYLQEQADDLSEASLKNSLGIWQEKQELRGRLSDWQGKQDILSGHISEQLEDLAHGEIRTVRSVLGEVHERQRLYRRLKEEIARLREDTDTNAYTAMSLAVQLSRKASGVGQNVNPMDWSNAKSLMIPEPRCAVVNVTGIKALPTSKTAEQSAVMEFWDKAGNYFRKPIVCSAQGSTSMRFPKKNMKFDLLNEDGSEFELRIGNWVVQDSYHLKSYYTDYFRGVGAVSYKLLDQIMRTRGTDKDRPYKVGLGVTNGVTPTGGTQRGTDTQLDTGALCHPDGFPCVVYLNGEFYGIYSWQLKKHRKNYQMEKSNVKHIHLDGNTVYFRDGRIDWASFEIRNPNKLYGMDGKKYDGDSPTELIDESSANYDAGNKDHVRSAKVKAAITGVVSKFQEVKRLCNKYQNAPTEANLSAARTAYEEIFDPSNEIDYLIFSDVTYNQDGFDHNVQMTTYDGVKWFSTAYDLDQTFGGTWLGEILSSPQTQSVVYTWRANNTFGPCHCLPIIYKSELESRYRELRDAGIIETEHIVSQLKDWVSRIGASNYELEAKKWPDCPTYTDSIYRVKKWLDAQIANMDAVYHYELPEERTRKAEEQTRRALSELSGSIEALKAETIAHEALMRYEGDAGLSEQADELAYTLMRQILRERERNARLQEIETLLDEVLDGGVLEYKGAKVSRNSEVDDMMDDIFDGDGTGGQALSEIPDELKDEVTTPEDFDDMLDEIFGVNP